MENNNPVIMSAWEDVDIRTVDKSTLVDLMSVRIDDALPVSDRIASFVEQIKNPYCFRVGNVAVKVKYKDSGPTFQQNFEDLLRTV